MQKDCFICRKHRGEVNVPGGIIFQSKQIIISHSQIQENETEHYLGHIIIETQRHVSEVSELTDLEAQEVGLCIKRIANVLLRTTKMEHIYSFLIGDGVPHVHIHVIGRYPGAPKEFWNTKVDEWPDATRGGEKEIAELVRNIRKSLLEEYDLR
jgi:histidine triad (HIT) family protein